jgi:uncharacterized repeat protein (TIGR01451 family)
MASPRSLRRPVWCATVAALVVGGAAVVTMSPPANASSSGTVLFSQTFHDNTLDGPSGSAVLTPTQTGTNGACLTAAGNASANPLASCPTATDSQGSGKLRLTAASGNQVGAVFASTSVPTSQGLDVTFNSYQYGGSGADGIGFVLAAVNPADPRTPATAGPSGGSLGYSAQAGDSVSGLTDGYMGIGLDAYGNYSSTADQGSGCTNPPYLHAGTVPGQVVVRGPGNGTVGYCALASTATTTSSPALALRASTRAAAVVPVEVVINPTSSSVTTASSLAVPAGDYDVTFTPAGGTPKSLAGALPVAPAGLYPASWVNANGIPKQLTFGWVASTGGSTDYHEIDNAAVGSLAPVPTLAVSQTSYAAATPAVGGPVTYQVAASSSGATENSAVTVTETLPSGVVPVGASGPGWVCGAPSGQTISCTSSTSPFTSGAVTVNGVVTSSSVTQALIQSGTTAVASSGDANPGASSSAPAGTVPAAPAVTSISPTSGPAGGGNDVTVGGTGLSGATAIEIGTAAAFNAGTPTTLVLCSSSAAGCFTVTSATSLDISSMPAHAAGAVQVKVVSEGIAGTGAYTYNAGPALLFAAPPGGEAGVSYSDQLTVTGGTSPYTWSVSTGTPPPGVTLNASTGLLSGTPTTAGTYSFTVQVTDQSGLTASEPVSLPVIAGPALNFPAPPTAYTNTVYLDTLTESGGTSPYTWSVSTGSLPAGISLSADGNLTGTPTAAGTSAFTVKVTDANNQTATEATSLTVAALSTTFAAPPAGEIHTAYSDTLTAAGGTAPYTWSVNSGSLPPGITLTSAGVLAGTPTSAGSYAFSVKVTDQNNGAATTSVTLVIAAGPALNFTAPPAGEIGAAYSDTLTASGGTGPYAWSVSSGSLPAGITLNPSSGALSGTPTVAGTFTFTVEVTDADNQAATKVTTLVVAPSATVTASASSAKFGAAVTFTASVTPGAASGSVTFTDLLSSGPQSGQTITLGTVAVSGGTAALTTSLPAFNTNTVTATYSGDSAYPSAASSPAGVQVTAYSGEVMITQFRLSGPGGPGDQYVELYNAGPPASLAGFTLAASSGTAITVPGSAPVLPTGHFYLITGGSYSLSAIAVADLSAPSLQSTGLQVTAPDGPGTVVDAAGFAGAPAGFFTGTPLPALSGTPADQYAWVRLQTAGLPFTTGSNAVDFKLVSTSGGVVGGVQSTLGSPSPLASGSPTQANGALQSALLDPAKAANAAPNFVYIKGSPGLLTIRRTITNNSGTTITSAELRITSLSEANGAPEPGVSSQPPSHAALRLIDPGTATSPITITGGQVVTVQNLSVDAPASASPGGGLDTTLTIPLAGGLAPGATVSIALTFAVDHGGPYWFGYNIDAAAGSSAAAQHSAARRPTPYVIGVQAGAASRYAAGNGTLP